MIELEPDHETPTRKTKNMTTTTTKWDPVRDLRDVAKQFNTLFNTRYPTTASGCDTGACERSDYSPAVDVTEDDARYRIELDLPGVERDDVKVTVENDVLTIRGERKAEREEDDGKVHRIERRFGSFVRTFRVPEDADGELVGASFKNGVLSVSLPKAEKAKPREIEVHVD
jgi:HSP20 family protein